MAAMSIARFGRAATDLDDAVSACRSTAWSLGLFSLATNLLMLAPPLYMLQVYDRVMTTGHVETLVVLTLLTAGALLVYGLLEALRSAVLARVSCWLVERLGPAYLDSSVRARLGGDGAGAQPLRDLSQVQGFITSPALFVVFDAPWAPVFLGLIWLLHPTLGLLAVLSAALILAFGSVNALVSRSPAMTANLAQLTAMQQAEATIRNAEVVRAMGMLPAMVARWSASNGAALAAQLRAGERGALLIGLTKSFRHLVQSGTLGLGAYLVLRGEMSSGGMIASSIMLGRALGPVESGIASWKSVSSTRIAYSRLRKRAEALPPEPVRTRLPAPSGFVALDRVTYGPPGSRAPILQQVSFEAHPGEAIAVIGPSASGKSTLCRLLVGIVQPGSGEVRLDGSEVRHWNHDDLGRHLGYLPQDVELFAGTVRDNIARMGDVDDESVVEAAMLAHAHEMIQRLPQGYDTPIGDDGARLSGGQRQRIGLARAVYRSPRLIVLDEPNANLDQVGEAALSAAIQEMKRRGSTLLIVGHRPSTIAQADKILLLKEGRTELFGPREEVLKRLRVEAGGGRAAEAPAVGAAESQRA